jgi:hypothetical protein
MSNIVALASPRGEKEKDRPGTPRGAKTPPPASPMKSPRKSPRPEVASNPTSPHPLTPVLDYSQRQALKLQKLAEKKEAKRAEKLAAKKAEKKAAMKAEKKAKTPPAK